MITKRCIDEILMTARIDEVVGDFISLKRKGNNNFVGLCPFHNDKDPSLHVSPKLGIYKCFVCGHAGNAVHFLMELEHMTYPEALKYLAQKYNIEIEEDKKELTPEEIAKNQEREALLNITAFAEKYFIDQMNTTEEGKLSGLGYLHNRGFQDNTIKKFKLGYCPDKGDAFTQEALKNGYQLEYLLQTGLTRQSASGRLFDMYHGRVIFPIHNASGKTIGFGGRVLVKTDKAPKYYNSPESPIYHKSDVLYGFSLARKSIASMQNVYLVEGYTDVISMVEAGVENVVASSGTALTDGQIKLISMQTKNITVLYDGDKAGIKASLRGINMLIEKGMNVRVVLLPDGEDPDSFAKAHRDSELQEYLKENATDFIKFKAHILSEDVGTDPLKRSEMINNIIETVSMVQDALAQTLYVKECAQMFGVEEQILQDLVRKFAWQRLKMEERRKSSQNYSPQATPIAPPSNATPPLMTVEPTQENNLLAQKQWQDEIKVVPSHPIPDFFKPQEDVVELLEKQIVKLILQMGVYEVTVEIPCEDKKSYTKLRIDQYIFDEFANEEIKFKNPLYQKFYDEYAVIASKAQNQDEIMRYFANHPDEELQKLTIPLMMENKPEISTWWERVYDVTTSSIDNNCDKLNKAVEDTIIRFKILLISEREKFLMDELQQETSEDMQRVISQRIIELGLLRNKMTSTNHSPISM